MNKPVRCHFCYSNHSSKECSIEPQLAPFLKKKVADMMEEYIATYFSCPRCFCTTLKVVGNNRPSLDVICTECKKQIEVKSKCLSVPEIPNNITILHGQYDRFMTRLNENDLDLVIMIYSVDRLKKTIVLREGYVINKDIMESQINNIIIERNNTSTIININDKNKLRKIPIPRRRYFNFKDEIDVLIQNIKEQLKF
jgi:hypothetical protein